MQRFTDLYLELDRTNRNAEKLEALADYFRKAPPEDSIWVVYILAGKKIGRTVSSTLLRRWASEASGYPDWLVQESYHVVGDLSETLSLIIPFDDPDAPPPSLKEMIEQRLRPLGKMPADQQKQVILKTWRELTVAQRFVMHKLISGNFRVGVSHQSLVLALAKASEVEAALIAHRLSGNWQPTAEKMLQIMSKPSDEQASDSTIPYPFMLAHPLMAAPNTLGETTDWQIEWKWDGIRAQLIHRGGKAAIWSRGQELISGAFPELIQAAQALPAGTVIDGEILAWDEEADRPRPFSALQRRLNRKHVELSLWPDVVVKVIAFDLLQSDGEDFRDHPLCQRRAKLEQLIAQLNPTVPIQISRLLSPMAWDDLTEAVKESRSRAVEGVMIKRRDSAYVVGRPTGLWWKLKIEPYTVDAVLIAAQPGTGRRAGLLTDFTFGVWNEQQTELITIAKAYSGLTDVEMAEMDRFVRQNTTERFGPVHAVKPLRVLELGFEAIQRSDRHKSGIALRFPRILRIRDDKKPEDADALESLNQLLASIEGHP